MQKAPFAAFALLLLAPSASAQTPTCIGVPLGLSGADSVVAPSVIQAAQLAVDEINAEGDVMGRPLALEVADGGGGATRARGRRAASGAPGARHGDAAGGAERGLRARGGGPFRRPRLRRGGGAGRGGRGGGDGTDRTPLGVVVVALIPAPPGPTTIADSAKNDAAQAGRLGAL